MRGFFLASGILLYVVVQEYMYTYTSAMYNPVTEVLTMSVGRLLRHKFTEMPIQNENPENMNTAIFYFH